MNTLEEATHDLSRRLIIGGDFNAHLDPKLDSAGGKTIRKDSVKNIHVIDIKLAFDLVAISGESGTLIKNNIHGGRRDL